MKLSKVWDRLSNTSKASHVDDVYRSFIGDPYTDDSFIAMTSNLVAYAKKQYNFRLDEAIILARLSGKLTKDFKSQVKKYRSNQDHSVSTETILQKWDGYLQGAFYAYHTVFFEQDQVVGDLIICQRLKDCVDLFKDHNSQYLDDMQHGQIRILDQQLDRLIVNLQDRAVLTQNLGERVLQAVEKAKISHGPYFEKLRQK